MLHRARRDGVMIRQIPSDASGAVDPEALGAVLDERVKLIALTWLSANGRLANPIARIGAIAAHHSFPFLLDAFQPVGQVPADVAALKCDFLSATGCKFLRGPRSTGFLYVAEKWLSRPRQPEPAMHGLYGGEWTGPDSYRLSENARRFEPGATRYSRLPAIDPW